MERSPMCILHGKEGRGQSGFLPPVTAPKLQVVEASVCLQSQFSGRLAGLPRGQDDTHVSSTQIRPLRKVWHTHKNSATY